MSPFSASSTAIFVTKYHKMLASLLTFAMFASMQAGLVRRELLDGGELGLVGLQLLRNRRYLAPW